MSGVYGDGGRGRKERGRVAMRRRRPGPRGTARRLRSILKGLLMPSAAQTSKLNNSGRQRVELVLRWKSVPRIEVGLEELNTQCKMQDLQPAALFDSHFDSSRVFSSVRDLRPLETYPKGSL